MTQEGSMPVRIPNAEYERLKTLRDEMGGVSTATYGEVVRELIETYDEETENG